MKMAVVLVAGGALCAAVRAFVRAPIQSLKEYAKEDSNVQ